MTQVLITVDTELSAGRQSRGPDARANFESSIVSRCEAGDFGIGWQMDRLEAHGLKGVFFVDPMPGLVHGEGIIADIVAPILARGHEVQLHIHTEWLEWALDDPVAGRRGRNIGDFSFDDQVILLGLARDMLVRTGAPAPTAFRAGNYGANDDTLRALAALGIGWDSSVNADYLSADCKVTISPDQIGAVAMHGITEMPVAGLLDRPGHFRPAQICAISGEEMRSALRHAAVNDHAAFVIVTHSFEMLSRDRLRPNYAVMRRFENLCRTVAEHPGLKSAGFHNLDPAIADLPNPATGRLPANIMRTTRRLTGQAIATWRYERRLRPA